MFNVTKKEEDLSKECSFDITRIRCCQCNTLYNVFKETREARDNFHSIINYIGKDVYICSFQCFVEYHYEKMISDKVGFDAKLNHSLITKNQTSYNFRGWRYTYNKTLPRFYDWFVKFALDNKELVSRTAKKFGLRENFFEDETSIKTSMKRIVNKPNYLNTRVYYPSTVPSKNMNEVEAIWSKPLNVGGRSGRAGHQDIENSSEFDLTEVDFVDEYLRTLPSNLVVAGSWADVED